MGGLQKQLDFGPVGPIRLDHSSELFIAASLSESPAGKPRLMDSICERGNMCKALKRVLSNDGAPGIDGVTVQRMARYFERKGDRIITSMLEDRYKPAPVRGTEIPKNGRGEMRPLGIPNALDRLVAQATAQILGQLWDYTFSASSHGFRPKHSQHTALRQMKVLVNAGHVHCVSIDISKFFDRVNHDRLMSMLAKRIRDKRVLRLIRAFLNAGVMRNGVVIETKEGTPQGSPLSPLLSNIVLDELDKELERRGLNFVRYADDCVILVRSRRAGQRVMKSVTRFITRKLKLQVNEQKSRVAEAWYIKYLGCSFTMKRGDSRIRIHSKSIDKFKDRIRELTRRKRGRSLAQVIEEHNAFTRGWWNYFRIAETRSQLPALRGWIFRRFRALVWHHWKNPRTRVRHLKGAGVGHEDARKTGNTRKKAWRLSTNKWVVITLPNRRLIHQGLVPLGT
ncbi:group II intron reverse transcriptase/maturase [Verrucomicrobiota bacterium]